MQVEINGEKREVEKRTTLTQLIEQLSLAPERLAIELNHTVVRRADWPHTPLHEGDHIEIVHFVGGGEGKCRRMNERRKAVCFSFILHPCFSFPRPGV